MQIVNPSSAGDKPSAPTLNGCWESWLFAISCASIQAAFERERRLEELSATASREVDRLHRELEERRAA